ncbi:hypothetical protein ACHAW6_004600 [Cyclotella cf. meneghiniana]
MNTSLEKPDLKLDIGQVELRETLLHRHQSQSAHLISTQLKTKQCDADEDSIKTSSIKEILLLVFPLLLVYISNQWSRYSISYLVDFSTSDESGSTTTSLVNAYNAMNIDIGFTETQYGLLASTSFTVLFAMSSLMAGNLADRYDRKVLTLTSCAVWALATLTQSFAHSYEEILFARTVMGGACAFAVPAAYSLIADRVNTEKVALANSIYASGVYLGGALASLSLLFDGVIGWRRTMGMIGWYGLISLVVSVVILPLDTQQNAFSPTSEDFKDETENINPSLMKNSIEILSTPRLQYLLVASFFRFSAGLIIAIWAPTYYKQAFPNNMSQYAVINAVIKGVVGITSGILGGSLAGNLVKFIENRNDAASMNTTSFLYAHFDQESIPLLLPIISSFLSIPTWYLAIHPFEADHSFEIAMFWLSMEYLVAECWFGPTIAVLQASVAPSNRGTAQGFFVLAGALGNISPTVLGWIYGNSGLQFPLVDLLGYVVCSGYLLSSLFFAASAGRKTKKRCVINNPR